MIQWNFFSTILEWYTVTYCNNTKLNSCKMLTRNGDCKLFPLSGPSCETMTYWFHYYNDYLTSVDGNFFLLNSTFKWKIKHSKRKRSHFNLVKQCIRPTSIYLLKVENRNTKTRCAICLKLTIKTPEQHHWPRSGVFNINFEHISHLVLVFLLLTLNIQLSTGQAFRPHPLQQILIKNYFVVKTFKT